MDGGADAHWVAVPPDRDARPVQGFGAFTADLDAVAAWLRQCQSETVVMESTGVDGMAWFAVLDERGFDVKLGDPPTVRQVPGRKTDVQDGQWRQALHTSGFRRGAFRPEDAVCVWRRDWRQRRMRVAMASRAGPHRQQALEQMHLKVTEVGRAIPGKPGMTIIRAMLAGARAPQVLAPSRALSSCWG
jgi:transposase